MSGGWPLFCALRLPTCAIAGPGLVVSMATAASNAGEFGVLVRVIALWSPLSQPPDEVVVDNVQCAGCRQVLQFLAEADRHLCEAVEERADREIVRFDV